MRSCAERAFRLTGCVEWDVVRKVQGPAGSASRRVLPVDSSSFTKQTKVLGGSRRGFRLADV